MKYSPSAHHMMVASVPSSDNEFLDDCHQKYIVSSKRGGVVGEELLESGRNFLK